jgi:hypothetical protein
MTFVASNAPKPVTSSRPIEAEDLHLKSAVTFRFKEVFKGTPKAPAEVSCNLAERCIGSVPAERNSADNSPHELGILGAGREQGSTWAGVGSNEQRGRSGQGDAASPPPDDHAGQREDIMKNETRGAPDDFTVEAALVDPLQRALAQPVGGFPLSHGAATPPALEQMAAQLLRRCSLSGDGRSGRVRLEIAAGDLSGSVVELHYDAAARSLHVEVGLGGASAARPEQLEAIRQRLLERGLPLVSFDVV